MLNRYVILFLLAASQLSAETPKDPVRKTLSQRQKVVLCSGVVASNLMAGAVFSKALLDCFFSKSLGGSAKALKITKILGFSMVLAMIELKFLERYSDVYWD